MLRSFYNHKHTNISSLARTVGRTVDFSACVPDIDQTIRVKPNQHFSLIPEFPLRAGQEFHQVMLRMADNGPLVDQERAYIPFINGMRKLIFELGVDFIEFEKSLNSAYRLPGGICDMKVRGGPQKSGIIEVKVRRGDSTKSPVASNWTQLGAYTRLAAGKGSFDRIWAALVLVEIENKRVRLIGYSSARPLIETSVMALAA